MAVFVTVIPPTFTHLHALEICDRCRDEIDGVTDKSRPSIRPPPRGAGVGSAVGAKGSSPLMHETDEVRVTAKSLYKVKNLIQPISHN